MTPDEIRLECLRLAQNHPDSPDEIISMARKFSDFVVGTRDAEIIAAARDFVKQIG